MLLRNVDQSAGLCNGTYLVVNHLGDRVIQATVISSSNIGYKVFIPRITLTPTDNSQIPVAIQRTQFPVSLCFAMTINTLVEKNVPAAKHLLRYNCLSSI